MEQHIISIMAMHNKPADYLCLKFSGVKLKFFSVIFVNLLTA